MQACTVTWPCLGYSHPHFLVLTNRDCDLTHEFTKLLYQVTTQLKFLHTVLGSSPSLTWPTSCTGTYCSLAQMAHTYLALTMGCYSPALTSLLPIPALRWFREG